MSLYAWFRCPSRTIIIEFTENNITIVQGAWAAIVLDAPHINASTLMHEATNRVVGFAAINARETIK